MNKISNIFLKRNTNSRIFLFFLLLVSFGVHSNETTCNSIDVDKYLGAEKAKFISITTSKSRKWTKNYFKALKKTYIFFDHFPIYFQKKNLYTCPCGSQSLN